MAVIGSKPDPAGERGILNMFRSGEAAGGNEGRVYWGLGPSHRPRGAEEKGRLLKSTRWLTEDEAMNDFYGWSDRKRSDFTAQLILAGLVPLGAGALEAEESWRKLVESAARYGAAGAEVSPWDLLTGYVKAAGGVGKDAWKSQGAFEVNVVTGERRYVGPGVYLGDGRAQQTDTRVDLTDPDTARAMATRLFQQMMGRDPGAGELGAFASALHAAESANPVTQTTTTTYNMDTGQPIGQETTSSGGMTAEGKAYIGEQQIKGKKEYGVTQAVTHLQNSFEDLIFGSRG